MSVLNWKMCTFASIPAQAKNLPSTGSRAQVANNPFDILVSSAIKLDVVRSQSFTDEESSTVIK